jgi:hypothetical protein
VKIATAWAQLVTTEEIHQCIRMRVLPWSNTFVSVGQVRINSALLVNQCRSNYEVFRKMEEGKI